MIYNSVRSQDNLIYEIGTALLYDMGIINFVNRVNFKLNIFANLFGNVMQY